MFKVTQHKFRNVKLTYSQEAISLHAIYKKSFQCCLGGQTKVNRSEKTLCQLAFGGKQMEILGKSSGNFCIRK